MNTSTLYRSIVLTLCLAPFAAAQQAPNNAGLPTWMKPGLRLTYFQGSATVAASRYNLVPAANGGWTNTATGQSLGCAETMNTGGAAYNQLTVVAANQQTVAAESHLFMIRDPQNDRVASGKFGSIIGTPDGLGDFWLSPAKLAAMQEGRDGVTTVVRLKYPLGGHLYHAIAMEVRTRASLTRHVYDLESGLLLVLSTSADGEPVFVPNPDGTVTQASGSTTITSTYFMHYRQLNLPWLNDSVPASVRAGTRLNYSGSYGLVTAFSRSQPFHQTVSYDFGQPGSEWVPAQATIHNVLTPVAEKSDLALSAASNMPLWLNPRSVENLEAGQELDVDPITHFRTIYDGVRGNVFVMHAKGPFDSGRMTYSLRSGVCLDMFQTQQGADGRVEIHLVLVDR